MVVLQAVHTLLEASEGPAAAAGGAQAAMAATAVASPGARLRQAAAKASEDQRRPGGTTIAASARAASALGCLNAPWEQVRGTLQKNFQARVQRFDAARLTAAVCSAVRAALPSGTQAFAAVDKASVACGPMYAWACASLELAGQLQAAAPLEGQIAHMQAELQALSERRAATGDEACRLRDELAELEAMEESIRREVEALGEYDDWQLVPHSRPPSVPDCPESDSARRDGARQQSLLSLLSRPHQ